MKYRGLVLFGMLAAMVAVSWLPLAAQAPRSAEPAAGGTTWTPPRTAWGDPDLQGIWMSQTTVPLERPVKYGNREFLTDQEVDALAKAGAQRNAKHEAGEAEARGFGNFRLFNSVWGGPRVGRIDRRTTAIVDPPGGRLPAWTPLQVKRYEAQEAAQRGRGEADSWEDRWYHERCIIAFWAPRVINWGMSFSGRESEFNERDEISVQGVAGSRNASGGPIRRFLQTPGYVAITMEEQTASGVESGAHRIIPLDRRGELGSTIRQWMGRSRGHWDGNTLVVVTKNIYYDEPILTTYGERARYPWTGETLTVTERFKPVDANTLEYSYTVEDPEVYTRPYTVSLALSRNDDFQFAPELCRENNWRNLGGQLASTRVDEVTALKRAENAARIRQQRMEELKAEWAAEWKTSAR